MPVELRAEKEHQLEEMPLQTWIHVRSRTTLRSSMLGSLFGSVCSIDITFDAEQNRKTAALGPAAAPSSSS